LRGGIRFPPVEARWIAFIPEHKLRVARPIFYAISGSPPDGKVADDKADLMYVTPLPKSAAPEETPAILLRHFVACPTKS